MNMRDIKAFRKTMFLAVVMAVGAATLLAAAPIQAQSNRHGATDVLAFLAKQPAVEYGRTEELNGVTRLFVYSGLQIKERQNLLDNIKKKLSQVIFTDKPEDAEVYLVFESVEEEYLFSMPETTTVKEKKGKSGGKPEKRTTVTTRSDPFYQKVVYGRGLVFKRVGEDRVRLVMEFKDTRKNAFEREPSTNFARAFVKAFREAGNLN